MVIITKPTIKEYHAFLDSVCISLLEGFTKTECAISFKTFEPYEGLEELTRIIGNKLSKEFGITELINDVEEKE